MLTAFTAVSAQNIYYALTQLIIPRSESRQLHLAMHHRKHSESAYNFGLICIDCQVTVSLVQLGTYYIHY